MKKSVSLLLSTILFSASLVSPVSAFAEDNTATQPDTQIEANDDLNYYKNSEYFDVNEQSNGDTVVTISDSNLIALLKEKGIDTNPFNRLLMARANGTTKIVWHGAARNGNVDVYLSKNVLNGMLNIGVGGIAAIVATLFPGVGTAVASVVASSIAGNGLFNNGVIYKIRGFRLSTIVYQ
ncbi:hypothetical protein GIX45_17580 [Erwinia sp. CPCC 100877]|nr:hypothetical protein [Erwinia sp. CPCC 100877]